MSDYKSLAVGSYGTSKVPGLEIIKYTGAKQNNDGSIRHSFLVKALMPSREQAELIAKAKLNGGGSNPYLDEPDFEGTSFLALNLRNEWLNPALVAAAMGREDLYLAQKKADKEQIEAAHQYLVETATETAKALGDVTEEKVTEDLEKLKQKISIEVGTIFRLQRWSGVDENEQVDISTLSGTKFSGSIVGREYNGKTFLDVRVRPKGK